MCRVSLSIMLAIGLVFAGAICGEEREAMNTSVYSDVAAGTSLKNGVKEISYDQFMKIRNSGQDYVLFDVLTPDSYAKGHIEGARSFPVNTITKDTAAAMLTKDSGMIVYCGSFQCGASTAAAKKLSELGYKVLDYKGGLKEWQEKGNKLVSNSR